MPLPSEQTLKLRKIAGHLDSMGRRAIEEAGIIAKWNVEGSRYLDARGRGLREAAAIIQQEVGS